MMNLGKPARSLGAVILLLVVGGGGIYWMTNSPSRGSQEETILWLAPPTYMVSWQRFVQALRVEVSSAFGDTAALDLDKVAPLEPGTTPEVVLSHAGRAIRWRWAIQTGDLADLLEREIGQSGKVLGVIGGSTTESALQLARALNSYSPTLPDEKHPVLILQTATAEWVYGSGARKMWEPENAQQQLVGSQAEKLMSIYPGKTFRFGFNNSRIAEVVTKYICGLYQPISPRPAMQVVWEDDPYGVDVLESFQKAYARQVGAAGGGQPVRIRSGVGALDTPNRHEMKAAGVMANELAESRKLGRSWIVMGGQADPCRRFLTALSRKLPTNNSKDLPLIAFGDTPGFNRVFRDQRLLWPIDDLPFELVFFCHQDPSSRQAGFGDNPPADQKWQTNSTDDLLLWRNIAGGLIAAWGHTAPNATSPKSLCEALSLLTVENGSLDQVADRHDGLKFTISSGDGRDQKRFFDREGDRLSGTGEHLVHLEPAKDGLVLRVIPVGQGENFSRRQKVLRVGRGGP